VADAAARAVIPAICIVVPIRTSVWDVESVAASAARYVLSKEDFGAITRAVLRVIAPLSFLVLFSG
jgi:hypothetical protein